MSDTNIYSIYVAKNILDNDKPYVGFAKNFDERKRTHLKSVRLGDGSNSYFYNAIRKHGEEAFTWECIFQAKGDLEVGKWLLNTIESHFIQEYKSTCFLEGHNGYNMTLGGDGALGARPPPRTNE